MENQVINKESKSFGADGYGMSLKYSVRFKKKKRDAEVHVLCFHLEKNFKQYMHMPIEVFWRDAKEPINSSSFK